jgi:N-acetylneuraminic acid mutarotase
MKYAFILLLLVVGAALHGQTANSWVKKNDFAGFKREQAVSFVINAKGYVATGVDTSETVLKDLWEYNPTADSWTQRADLPGSARRNAVGFAINGKGYVGTGIDNNEATIGTKLFDFWEYDPVSNTWLQKANFPGDGGLGIYYATGFSVGGKGYVCGGKTGASNYSDEFWEYKPVTNQWTQRQNFPGGIRYNMSSLTIGNVAYVGLGTDQNVYRYDWWEYNPGNNLWTQKNHFIGGQRAGASTFELFGNGYVCLGTNGGLKDDLYMYVPAIDAWYPRANFGGNERKQAISFAINNVGYVGTGAGVNGKKGSMYAYYPMESLALEENALQLTTFPNPSVNSIQISSKNYIINRVVLFNQVGQQVYEANTESLVAIIDRNQLPAGTYTVLVALNNGAQISKSTIQFID